MTRTCIHARACRRLSKIMRSKGINIPRGCNENCTAYFDGTQELYVTADEACRVARQECGYHIGSSDEAYEMFVPSDFEGMTLNHILAEEDND